MSLGLPEVLERVARLASLLGRPYAVIGGVAMIARARVRPTQDVDLVVRIGPEDVGAVLRHAAELDLAHDDDATSRELFEAGLIHLYSGPREGGVGVDIMFADSPFLERVTDRATPVELGPATLQVATVEDLLLLKLEANRPIDLDDAIALKDAHGASLDRAYVDARARELGIERAVETLLGTAG